MLAARSSGGGIGGPHPLHVHRKQSVASLSGTKGHRSNSQDAKRNSSAGKQGAQLRQKATLIREMETTWYLKMFGLGKEETVAHKTGMPYSVKTYVGWTGCDLIPVFVTDRQHK
ncbi:voltage-gated potassium channel subunit beta-1 isoform X2 [Solea senegalensis]|uniref:Voltage-gated potassium channel subunit beta-1 isoform X2 n=1 Tax=Solea senegalensis TaxID=28829 RepID=A0AAV6PV23_SOLSE|nr:voltage-gated potassium channel subunit beta-1 isoform X2 [Solea senegalensis]